ncbi:citrate synthase [Longispora fulva]|uniref:citrate synthase (unknown stereospecificity) n=1 Tax=Longispora fulva TaxID=619741 RepID=A0A8J7GNW8_9ACTN|nr:citrate synthase [Longispora fulva]MBG6135133.1 citrate synthase [Longispora fulva]GIG56632.1 citrate synthase [Longispora fulva]
MDQLTTDQAAARLGVKPETVYAYVSRGLLHSTRAKDGRGSLFDPAEVEQLAARGARNRPVKETGPVIRTGLTLIRDGRLCYRGRDAADLAVSESFESVASLLWSGTLDPTARFSAPAGLVDLARAATSPLSSGTRLTDRLRVIVAVAASADPERFNIQPDAVAGTGAALLATMVDALPLLGAPPTRADAHVDVDGGGDRSGNGIGRGTGTGQRHRPAFGDLAARLWPRLTSHAPTPDTVRALNAALVLLADHDLAASTFAARVAASARAHPYAVVAAGLSAFDGPLHGAAASQAHRLLAEAIATGDPLMVYSERLRVEGRVEGFFHGAHPLYPDGDVRALVLLGLLDDVPTRPEVRAAVDGLLAAAGGRSRGLPNIEFALAVLAHVCGMTPGAGEAVFALARTAGWIAHALEEYEEPGLRFRYQGTYTGPEPV